MDECPFCHQEDARIVTHQEDDYLSKEGNLWRAHVLCQNCGATGPSVGGPDVATAETIAVNRWDARHMAAETPPEKPIPPKCQQIREDQDPREDGNTHVLNLIAIIIATIALAITLTTVFLSHK